MAFAMNLILCRPKRTVSCENISSRLDFFFPFSLFTFEGFFVCVRVYSVFFI